MLTISGVEHGKRLAEGGRRGDTASLDRLAHQLEYWLHPIHSLRPTLNKVKELCVLVRCAALLQKVTEHQFVHLLLQPRLIGRDVVSDARQLPGVGEQKYPSVP